MAPRANWKGFLRLSLVTCPVALYPATSESEKISFNQINRTTGHRIKYLKVDADTGEEVSNEDITKGYKIDTDIYVEVSKDELENIALESTRTIDIDEFVPKSSIDPRYLIRPYYLVPDGESWARRFRCHPGNYPQHIVSQKTADFEPERFEDHYEVALTELINAKRQGKTISPRARPSGGNVVDLMDALKKSVASEASAKGKKPRKAAAGQKEMLLPIEGRKPAEKKAAKPERSVRRRKAG
jgi:non-homologous end joining protein Ku